MVQLSALLLTLAVSGSALAAPSRWHTKRIAQDISTSTTQWEKACDAAKGGDKCNPVAVAAFSTLLAAPGPCAQQDNADKMVDLAKTLNNDPNMIKLAQIFAQQPRNTPSSESVQYCQTAPKNKELDGLFQCQFQGANPTQFVGDVKVGAAGTIPFGLKAALSPAGSCPAHPAGPIPDGTQLVDLVSASGAGGGSNGTEPASTDATSTVAPAPTASATATATTSDAALAPTSTASSGSGSSDFHLQNGKDAQALNKKFAALTADSTCQEGDQACVGGAFAQCVGGKFASTPCAGGTTCAALPLVNKAGTSITCDTQDDALARIAATGATGGLTGN
ncbi:hypothetical protein FA95DRAFT_1495149 [Auriscalpium vulgare]|uniref:Uncharacterized protein n=1 Tax=Auriscalpium vulgare TaxID=40419 RepID=A0ACB8RPI2_9AGAM|nr:hypothetical protein FA95DRAFT_1495149 [Auriscalpium vulgare]